MFALKKQKAKVAHLNVREEKHGDDPVLACDVKLEADLGNHFLDELSKGLRAALYRAEGGRAGETFDMVADHLPVLRFPQLGKQKWEVGLVGAKLTLHVGKKADDLVFECDIKDAALEPLEGGTVTTVFQAAVLPTSEELAKLGEILGHEVKVSLEAVEQPAQPPLDGVEASSNARA